MHYPARRRQRLLGQLKEQGVDAFLISSPVNVSYLTGFSGDSSYLLLGRMHTTLVSDGRYTEQIEEECPGLDTNIRPPDQTLQQAVCEVVTRQAPRAVGFEAGHMTVAEFETLREGTPTINWKPCKGLVEKLRAVKDPSEVAAIREAISIAERAYAMFRAMLRPDDPEKELSDALEGYLRRAGARCSSFPSIVAIGERAALPHAPPTDKRLAEAPFVLVDWGASGQFYKSDLTRILVTRTISPFSRRSGRSRDETKLEKIYEVVLTAQQRALAAIRPGVKASDVDATARSFIADAGYGKNFVHGLGHGIGLQVHEAPSLRSNSQDVLEPGMVTTVEPGIYLPDWGGVRIEDDVLVTEDGCEVLSHVPRDFPSAVLTF